MRPDAMREQSARSVAFIDTNVLVYSIANNHPDYSPRCISLLEELALAQTSAVCAATAIFEAIYILHKQRGSSRIPVARSLTAIVRIPAISFEHREVLVDALRFWTDQSALDFADCYHLALTQSLGLNAIYTFDKKMDRYPGVTRLEP
jgi:predicted nucleic acid-binding protein